MNKKVMILVGGIASLLVLIFFSVLFHKESNIQAQENIQKAPERETEPLSVKEIELIQKVKSFADNIETTMKKKEPKWKLEKKFAGQTSVGFLNQEKGAGRVFGTTAYLQFKKKATIVDVDFQIKEPFSDGEASEIMKFGLSRISRGIVNDIAGIGDEAVIVSDSKESLSNYVYISFRSGKILTTVGANSRSGTRSEHEKNAREIAMIVDSVISSVDLNGVNSK